MTDPSDPSDPPARVPAAPAATLPATPEPAARDAHGFDPGEFEWRPVARRPRSDGWTPEVQRRFIEALADTGLVSAAAQAVDMSVTSCYRLRRAPGSENFAKAWRAALAAAAERVLDIAFERAIQGEEVPVFHQGRRIGQKTQYNDRMAMFIMRAYLPDRFRFAHDDAVHGGEALAAPEPPVAEAVRTLAPVVPAAPHLSLPPDERAACIEDARLITEIYADAPLDLRERYVWPREEDTSWAAVERREPAQPAEIAHYNETPEQREDRLRAFYGEDDDDA